MLLCNVNAPWLRLACCMASCTFNRPQAAKVNPLPFATPHACHTRRAGCSYTCPFSPTQHTPRSSRASWMTTWCTLRRSASQTTSGELGTHVNAQLQGACAGGRSAPCGSMRREPAGRRAQQLTSLHPLPASATPPRSFPAEASTKVGFGAAACCQSAAPCTFQVLSCRAAPKWTSVALTRIQITVPYTCSCLAAPGWSHLHGSLRRALTRTQTIQFLHRL